MNQAGRTSSWRGVFAMVGVVALACASAVGQDRSPAAGTATAPAKPVVIYCKDNAPPAPRLEDLPLKESVSRDGITWTFQKPARVGQFVNGDWYVVGAVTVVGMDPKPIYNGEVRNGSMLNPPAKLHFSAFDSRIPKAAWFRKEALAKLPIAMKPGDSLMSSISRDKPGSGGRPVKSFSILTCLKEPVPPDAFRPGYCDREQTIYLARGLKRELLPKLPRLDNTPSLAQAGAPFQRPWHHPSYLEDAEAEYEGGGYGRAICQMFSNATLLLCLDFKPEEKEPVLIDLIGMGLDLWSIISSETFGGWTTLGGWGSGRKWPIVFAGVMLGDEKMACPSKSCPRIVFQEDNQTFYDDCWTGAGVVYGGHVGWRDVERRPYGWGPYEHLHPTRWTGWIGTSYRTNMTSSTWIGQALAVRLLRAEKEWAYDAFLDYCDRWMYEPDPGYRNPTRISVQGNGYDLFQEAMWKAYRQKLPDIPGRDNSPRPTDGWRKKREMKSPPVEMGKNRELIVKKQPFLPIMIWAEHPGRVEDALAIGANVLAEGCFEKSQNFGAYWKLNIRNDKFLDELAAKGLYGLFGADARTVGHQALLGWLHVDEADAIPAKAAGMPDKQLQELSQAYRAMRAARSFDAPQGLKDVPDEHLMVEPAHEWMEKMDASRPAFLTVGEAFLQAAADGKSDVCRRFLKNCDAVGCAVYPLTALNSPARLDEVAKAVSKLVELAPGKCVYAWIETGPPAAAPQPRGRAATQPAPAAATSVKPQYIRAEVWMAIIRGATGIGYRGFEGLDVKVKPAPDVLAELKKVNAKLASLAPAILAEPAKAKVEMSLSAAGGAGNLACHTKATELAGSLYVFAQNIDLGEGAKPAPSTATGPSPAAPKPAAGGAQQAPGGDIAPRAGKATIKVPGLKAGTKIEVVDENRSITAEDGRFSDDFAPLAEHVYKLPGVGR